MTHPDSRGKLDHLFYNPLQAKEFRIYRRGRPPRTPPAAPDTDARARQADPAAKGAAAAPASGPNASSAVSGRTLRYMSRPGGCRQRHDLGVGRSSPRPGARIMFPTSVSSSVSSRSCCRKYGSPRSREDLADRPPFAALDLHDRSRETCARVARRRRAPTVVFPDPGRPTRIRCGFDGSAAEPGCDVRKVGVIVPSASRRANRRRTSRATRRRARTPALPPR